MTNTRTLDRDCCDYEVYSHGKVIGVFDMPKDEANELVVKLSKKTGNRIDWHYVGGRVVMKMLHPKASVNSRTLISRNKREGLYTGKHSGWCLDFTIEPYYREWPAKHCRQGFDQYSIPLRYLKGTL